MLALGKTEAVEGEQGTLAAVDRPDLFRFGRFEAYPDPFNTLVRGKRGIRTDTVRISD